MYSDLNSIYIELSGSLIFYKINKIQKHKSFFLRILIDEINNENDAKKF